MELAHSSTTLNGSSPQKLHSPHKHKHHKDKDRKHKYVLDSNGKPKIGPDGKRIRIKREHRPEHHTANHAGDQGVMQVKTERMDSGEPHQNSGVTNHGDSEEIRRMKKKLKKEKHAKKRKAEENDVKPNIKKVKTKAEPSSTLSSPTKKKTKKMKEEEEAASKWKWWEEKKDTDDGIKWKTLEHKGPMFAPEYEPLPSSVPFKYGGKVMHLEPETEEVMTFYAKMLDHDYTSKEIFNKNFFHDWRKVMTSKEKEIITDLGKCDFRATNEYFKMKSEERKARSKEEKQKEKEEKDLIQEEYGFCMWDNHKEKIGNFRLEPPSLFRGRGDHPKMGKIKKRLQAKDIIINCSKGSKVPSPPPGQKWKEVRHDNTVTWLVSWTENIQGQNKYIMLNANSRIKGEKDWQKYETARKLKDRVDKIRQDYWRDMKSQEMAIRQRAVALFFIDKLALRAGNEKEEGEGADTVGCCSLRCEHIKTHKMLDMQEYVIEFDFLGKDSIRYYNKVPVPKQVFKNVNLFMENKDGEDDLFDRLTTSNLNKYLNSLMDGLTAKVFRTYNASITLQQQLNDLTDPDDTLAGRMLSYNRSNRAVAILCNHQRAAPKNFSEQMQRARERIQKKQDDIADAKQEVKSAKSDFKHHKTESNKKKYETKKKKVERLQEQLIKLEVQATDREENKEIALGTSKLNYLDPRISVAWCKKWDVPIEKVYNKTQRDKFAWAIAMVDETYVF
uniref:DNA topoisomerase I, mitochondrial-like n=1 Tax=Styela clava TaxID=7725 RepID=UPI00193A51BA|nr:DNA topoisomerase I, mitochondrial-like [Styela clava]